MALRISVALCTYNGAAYLPQQLESLSKQSRRPDELVVFDDCSTDATLKILHDFKNSAPFEVRIHCNEKTLGSSANFHQCINECRGDVIALCDQDDQWLPVKLQLAEAEFLRQPELGYVFTDAEICDEHCEPLGYGLWKSVGFTPALQRRVRDGDAFGVLVRQNMVTGATMVFASRYRPLVLPIDARWFHDGWIALLIAAVAPVAMISQPLICYRQHPAQCVGALKRSFYQQYCNARQMDREVFARHAELYQAALDRLQEKSSEFPQSAPLALLKNKIAHYRIRSAIRLRQSPRILPSLTELLTLRYDRYSLGWKSFAQDIFL